MCTVHVKKMLRRKKLQVKKNPKIENKERKLVDWHHYNRYEQMKKEIKKLNEIRTSGIIAHLYITNYVFFFLICFVKSLFYLTPWMFPQDVENTRKKLIFYLFSIYLSMYQIIYLFINLSIYLSIKLSMNIMLCWYILIIIISNL